MTKTVDYSYSYVGAETIARDGYIGAERYLGHDGRCLTVWERDELLGEGLGIGLIFESSADRSLTGGYWGGYDDATWANRCADEVGAAWVTIRYATDFHALPDQIAGPIQSYYEGVHDAGGRPPTVYGGAPVIDRMCQHLGFGKGWQAAAASWSNYVLSPNAVLLQEVEQVWNNAADTNIVLCADNEIDWLWGRSSEGDWFDMATEDDLRRVVREEFNTMAASLYTGQRACVGGSDARKMEVIRQPGTGELVRRVLPADQIKLLRYIDGLAEADWTGDARAITDPEMVATWDRLPVVPS